ncbi:unnamed protein product [Brugia timori]|uniref:Uncharacterized protein n=1 Tax=Brugia timori TaxID=42155 RepID=A0A3P7T1R2_9BILA|nr:unnamed protein product [Brugia timori]
MQNKHSVSHFIVQLIFTYGYVCAIARNVALCHNRTKHSLI